jgi:hypothetical protein
MHRVLLGWYHPFSLAPPHEIGGLESQFWTDQASTCIHAVDGVWCLISLASFTDGPFTGVPSFTGPFTGGSLLLGS